MSWWRRLTGGATPPPDARPEPLWARARELEIRAVRLVDGLLQGSQASVFRGSGVEAAGVRPYVPGDDVRIIDWRVTARTGRLHVRERVEERGLDVLLVVDRSASLHGGESRTPGIAALEVSAALAVAADRADHRVGLLQVTDRCESFLPPRRGRSQLGATLGALLALESEGRGTDLALALRAAAGSLSSSSLVVVVSDFLIAPHQRHRVLRELARLVRRHDVLPVRIAVPGPEALPNVGLVAVRDPETLKRVTMDTSSPAVRARFQEAAAGHRDWWAQCCGSLGLWPLELDPTASLAPQLCARLAWQARRVA